MASSFIIRIQHPKGMKRLTFASPEASWDELARQVQAQYGQPPDAQLLSLTSLSDPRFVEPQSGSQTLGSLGLRHGQILHLSPDEEVEAAAAAGTAAAAAPKKPTAAATVKLSPHCRHGPTGRCLNCSAHVKAEDGDKGLAPWLCNHGPDAFCPKCIPADERDPDAFDPEAEKRMCRHGPGQKCIHCAQQKAKIKVDKVPYAQWLGDRKIACHFKHAETASCPSCAAPPAPSFKGSLPCPRGGHAAWPHGVCSACKPANAVIRPQPYRHVDAVSFKDAAVGEQFVTQWLHPNPGLQICGIMFGRYKDEPVATGNVGAVRCEVYAIYQPPQTALPAGVRIHARDPRDKHVMKIAEALGDLKPVGWIVTTLPRSNEHGEILMSAAEICQAAIFQRLWGDADGRSKFVTMIIQHNSAGVIEPRVYQVSDQCVAMERDQVVQFGKDPGTLAPREQKPGEFVPSVIYKDRCLKAKEEFSPDEFIVKVVAMQPHEPVVLFKHKSFPPPRLASAAHVREYLAKYAREPPHERFSDFNLLCFLPEVIGLPLTLQLSQFVKEQQPLPSQLAEQIERACQ